MAKVSDIVKFKRKQKYPTRAKNRCQICGRSRSYIRKFGLCRMCFRTLASKGELPGIVKSTW